MFRMPWAYPVPAPTAGAPAAHPPRSLRRGDVVFLTAEAAAHRGLPVDERVAGEVIDLFLEEGGLVAVVRFPHAPWPVEIDLRLQDLAVAG